MKQVQPISKREQKRLAIIEAASHIFLERGYHASSMDDIAKVAGVAKQTIYSNFENKHFLFLAVMGNECDKKYSVLRESYEKGDVLSTLENFCENFIDLISSKESIALRRLLHTESAQNPELAKIFYENGPKLSLDELKNYLNHQQEKGRICCENTEELAYLFLNSLVADYLIADMLSSPPLRTREEIISSTINMFKNFAKVL